MASLSAEAMEIWANQSVLSIFPTKTEAYFYDGAGRLSAVWFRGWFVSRGLTNRMVARRWNNHQRQVRPLSSLEMRGVRARSQDILQKALHQIQESPVLSTGNGKSLPGLPESASTVEEWIHRSLRFDSQRDEAAFKEAYAPVGILPPDQYASCVVQITEGCAWNQCRFCTFYRGQRFRIKGRTEIRSHIESVGRFFGEGLSQRRSIFLGDANALSAPLSLLLFTLRTAREVLVPRMGPFRGFYSFIEPSDSSGRSVEDFRLLAEAGLRRVYYGLETGDADLRKALVKPGALAAIEQSIQQTKTAGLRVAVILLIGAGGRPWQQRHAAESISFIRKLRLSRSDIIFLSPLRGRKGAGDEPLADDEMRAQMHSLKTALEDTARVAPYDIREFVY